MRLIDADEAYKVLTDYYNHRTEIQHKALKEAIGRVPSVDAEPVKHGHWTSSQGLAEVGEVQCSNCKTVYYVGDLYDVGETDENGMGQALMPNYCPHCGAKMEAEDAN